MHAVPSAGQPLPALPGTLGELPVEWRPWEPRRRITHVDQRCEGCQADVDRQVTSRGTVDGQVPGICGLPLRAVRYTVTGCLACRLVVVDDIYPRWPSSEIDPCTVWRSDQMPLFGG
jgi:hypothetical protein